jgi:hypothetical protein
LKQRMRKVKFKFFDQNRGNTCSNGGLVWSSNNILCRLSRFGSIGPAKFFLQKMQKNCEEKFRQKK